MPSQTDYRLVAQYYLGLARGCSDLDMADRLRAVAAGYFDLAEQVGESASVIQQQQVQPDEDAE